MKKSTLNANLEQAKLQLIANYSSALYSTIREPCKAEFNFHIKLNCGKILACLAVITRQTWYYRSNDISSNVPAAAVQLFLTNIITEQCSNCFIYCPGKAGTPGTTDTPDKANIPGTLLSRSLQGAGRRHNLPLTLKAYLHGLPAERHLY